MKLSICFFDSALAFDVATPFEQPLGGSQSAMSYLAIELARRGHRVTVMSKLARPRTVHGVECLNVEAVKTGLPEARRFDAFIVCNASAPNRPIKQNLPPETAFVLWNGHATDQPSIQDLATPAHARQWDKIVCVSDWLRGAMIETFRLDPNRTSTIRNAIGPRFENMFESAATLEAAKASEPLLVYTSTPFRGLDLLVRMFPSLRAACPAVQLEIYSAMSVYQVAEDDDPLASFYERMKSLTGVRYCGAVSQTALAAALRRAAILSYPNTFAETSCIAVMEALAAGLHVVTSNLGALPETCMGLADLVAPPVGPDDMHRFGQEFGQQIVNVIVRRNRNPAAFAEQRFAQVQAINRSCTWRLRAQEWESAIVSWRNR